MVKNLPAMRETWVLSLGQEDPLEKGKATYSSSLAWRISWTEEPGGLWATVYGVTKSGTGLNTHKEGETEGKRKNRKEEKGEGIGEEGGGIGQRGPCPLGPWQRAWGRTETVVLAGEAMALATALGWVEGPFLGSRWTAAQLQSPQVIRNPFESKCPFQEPLSGFSGMWKYKGWVRGATGLT